MDCAREWQMDAVRWMFQESQAEEVKADVEMMMELRQEVSDSAKSMEKVLAIPNPPKTFLQLWGNMKVHVQEVKDSGDSVELRCFVS